jgi:hypothetical protein
MEWIKKNPHLLTLALLALLLVGASAMVFMQAQSLPQKFEAVQQPVIPNEKVPPLETKALDEMQQSLNKPATWTPNPTANGPLFVPERYVIGDKGTPEKPEKGTKIDSFTKQPIPNQWFIENGLPVLDPAVTRQDPDGDLFWNEDEWRGPNPAAPGMNSTNPNDPKSHPPYHTKLFLKQYIRVKFELRFNSYNGDPKKPESLEFQIDTLNLRQPTQFLRLGDAVRGTKFKLDKFEFKTVVNPSTGAETDVSELTLLNTEFNEPVTLTLARVTDAPNSIAEFTYILGGKPLDFRVARLGTFALPQEKDKVYKLLDVKDTEAVITLPSGEKYTVQKLPAGYP